MNSLRVFFLLMFTAVLIAQTKPEPKTDATGTKNGQSLLIPAATSSVTIENKILKAEHDLDQVVAREQQMSIQFSTLQQQAEQLRAQYPAAQKEEADKRKAVDDAIDAAWKEHPEFDKKDYAYDSANFTFAKKKPAEVSQK